MAFINPVEYHEAVSLMREFFLAKGFVEVPTQCRLSILAACEDPSTINMFEWRGQRWPLPQTGQMWLEYELLKNPDVPGLFCVSTSYRNEPNPKEGRHETIFPMFEFETHGTMDDMARLECELLEFMGFGNKDTIPQGDWLEMAAELGTDDIDAEAELAIQQKYGDAFLLKNFPQFTSPFWNMKKVGDKAAKIDVLLHGMETIGSAERSCNPVEMRDLFFNISDGMYANILFDKFGRQRVEEELEEFLSHDFFPRYGGGIGVTRMIRALKLQKEKQETDKQTDKVRKVA